MTCVLLFLAFASGTLFTGQPVEKAWSLLESGLKEKSSDRRAIAAHSLGFIGRNTRARLLAIGALSDSSPDVRAQAAGALGEVGPGEARVKLLAVMNDKDLKVALAAADALYRLHDAAAYQVYYALITGKRKASGGLIQTQLNTLHDRRALEKMAFQTGIGFVPYASMGVEAWRSITHDDSSAIVAEAVLKLASDPDPKSLEAMKECAGNAKWQVRAALANAIGKRGDKRLLDTAVDMMLDDNDAVRYAAAGAVLHLEDRARRRGVAP